MIGAHLPVSDLPLILGRERPARNFSCEDTDMFKSLALCLIGMALIATNVSAAAPRESGLLIGAMVGASEFDD